jgi:hypothetical protein
MFIILLNFYYYFFHFLMSKRTHSSLTTINSDDTQQQQQFPNGLLKTVSNPYSKLIHKIDDVDYADERAQYAGEDLSRVNPVDSDGEAGGDDSHGSHGGDGAYDGFGENEERREKGAASRHHENDNEEGSQAEVEDDMRTFVATKQRIIRLLVSNPSVKIEDFKKENFDFLNELTLEDLMNVEEWINSQVGKSFDTAFTDGALEIIATTGSNMLMDPMFRNEIMDDQLFRDQSHLFFSTLFAKLTNFQKIILLFGTKILKIINKKSFNPFRLQQPPPPPNINNAQQTNQPTTNPTLSQQARSGGGGG